MLQSFFEIGADPELFDNLSISQNHHLCKQYMGQYPVISISLKGVDADSYTQARAQLVKVINREARRYQLLLESDKLSHVDKELFSELLSRNMEEATLTSSLLELTELLEIHYAQQVIVLIDEYDVPLAKAHENGYYNEMVLLLRNLFGNVDVYCPWDVVNYCNDHLNNTNVKPENYWMNTSSNNVINHFIDSIHEPDMLTKTELEWLVNGQTVIKKVDETITYDDLYSTMDNLWSTLL